MSSPSRKRPHSGGRHGSSWINKIHRKHDSVHHPERASLLQDESHESSPEPEPVQQSQASHHDRFAPCKNCFCGLGNSVFGAVSHTIHRTATTIKNAVSSTSNAVRRNPKKTLAATTGIFAVTSMGEGVDIIRHHPLPVTPAVCYTPECIHAANSILSNMHPSLLEYHGSTTVTKVDPCTDFDKFVCGGYQQRQVFEGLESYLSSTTEATKAVNQQIRDVLEQDQSVIPKAQLAIFTKAQTGYHACINLTRIEEQGLKPLKALISDIKSHFGSHSSTLRTSLVVQRAVDDVAFTTAYIHAMKQGLYPFMKLQTDPNLGVLYASPISPIGVDEAKQHGKLDEYKAVMKSTLIHVIDQPSDNKSTILFPQLQDTVDVTVNKIMQLEMRLHDLFTAYKLDLGTGTFNNMSLHHADKILPRFSISALSKEISGNAVDSVLVPAKQYLSDLADVIGPVPNEVIKVYFIWTAIKYYADHVDHNSLLPWRILAKQLSIRLGLPSFHTYRDRELNCVEFLNADARNQRTRLGWLLSELWLDKYPISSRDQIATRSIIRMIKSQFEQKIQGHRLAVQKLGHLEIDVLKQIGSKRVEKMYSGLQLRNENHFNNVLALANWEFDWAKTNLWSSSPSLVNSEYSSLMNKVIMPAAVAEPPFYYRASVPMYLQCGSLGYTVGHQIAHAFGSSKALPAPSSSTWPSNLWSNQTRELLEKEEHCFKKQYKELDHHGEHMLQEAVADHQGLRVAYDAWKKHASSHASDEMPGLSQFSKDQLFWMSFGNTQCSKIGDKMRNDGIKTGFGGMLPATHIKGAISNHEGFLKAFQCSKKPQCSWL